MKPTVNPTGPAYFLTQLAADLPVESSWLSPDEAARAAQFRFQKRRADWLLGRWTAKLAVQRYLLRLKTRQELPCIEIVSAPDGAPEVEVAGKPAAISISLSHSAGMGMAAVAEGSLRLGCDVERIEPRSPEFLLDYFTAAERVFAETGAADERAFRCTLIWSAKESALKWVREGLRLDTRAVGISFEDFRANWSPFTATCGRRLTGWWRRDGEFVLTVVAEDLLPPTAL